MTDTFYSRILQNRLASPRGSRPKIKLVFGPRQSGKSTLLGHHLADSENVHEVNLQDRRLVQRYEREAGLLIQEIDANPAITCIFVDEIQKAPGLLDDVQYLYDKYPGKYHFYLTGSSSRKLKAHSANLLPGRVHTLMLSPVMQAEQRDCLLAAPEPADSPRFPLRSLEEYLLYGNLPGLYHESVGLWKETISAYAVLYVENEIRQENLVNDMGAFLRFLKIAALESGRFVNNTKFARDVGVAANTLRNFYRILEDTYIGFRLNPFARSRRRIVSAPRFLIFDTGVRHALAGLPINQTLLALDAGRIFEQWVLCELYYRCMLGGPGYSLSTWRTRSGAEVDAIIETPDECIPVEVKWTDSPTPRDARHLEGFITAHSHISSRGYVVCRAPRKQKLSDSVIALPWNEF